MSAAGARGEGPEAGAVERGVVLVVEDDPLLQRALGRLLRSAGHRVELFDSVPGFLGAALPEEATCLVLDLHLPDGNGFEILESLEARGTPVSAVVITAHGDVPTAVRAMQKGAVELLEKPFDNRRLLASVADGLARDARARQLRTLRRAARERLAALSPREREVFALVVEGLPNKGVAARLGIAEKTIKIHRARIMQKTGAGSLPELVRIADAARGEEP